MISTLLAGSLVAMVAVAIVSDLRVRRIPNWLTGAGIVLALALRAVPGGPALLPGVAGAGIGLALGLMLFAIGALAAGDGKLLAAAGAFLGPLALAHALFWAALAGAVLGTGALVLRWGPMGFVIRVQTLVRSIGRGGLAALDVRRPEAVTVPYGVAIGAGILTSLMLP